MSDEMNPDQRKAAEFKDGICAVIAVPGSGKTRTMMQRIGLLVKNHGIPPEAILGLTFTRNAANERRNRLVPVLGDLSARVFLATIHSFCYWLLKFEGQVFERGLGEMGTVSVMKLRLQKRTRRAMKPVV